jgi:hypothetical protein
VTLGDRLLWGLTKGAWVMAGVTGTLAAYVQTGPRFY